MNVSDLVEVSFCIAEVSGLKDNWRTKYHRKNLLSKRKQFVTRETTLKIGKISFVRLMVNGVAFFSFDVCVILETFFFRFSHILFLICMHFLSCFSLKHCMIGLYITWTLTYLDLKANKNSDIPLQTAAIFFDGFLSKTGYWLGVCHG